MSGVLSVRWRGLGMVFVPVMRQTVSHRSLHLQDLQCL